MESRKYIKVNRNLIRFLSKDCDGFNLSPERHDDISAYIDLLMISVEKDGVVSVQTSVSRLCERWGWGNIAVNHYLKYLEENGIVTVEQSKNKQQILITLEGLDG